MHDGAMGIDTGERMQFNRMTQREHSDDRNTQTPRFRTEFVAGQHLPRPSYRGNATALYRRMVRYRPDIEPDDFPPGNQEQRQLRRGNWEKARAAKNDRGPLL